MTKFPEKIYCLNGCDVETLKFLALAGNATDSLAAYINIWSLEVKVIAIATLSHDPYYLDELAAIAQASAYIQRKLNMYSNRIDHLKKLKDA